MIPEKIKIGYKEYRLEKWKQTVASANEAQGQFFAKEGIIGYTDDEKGVSHANTLLHEIIHAIVYHSSLNAEGGPLYDSEDEEQAVNSMTNWLMGVFKDNPWLLDFLKENIHNKSRKK